MVPVVTGLAASHRSYVGRVEREWGRALRTRPGPAEKALRFVQGLGKPAQSSGGLDQVEQVAPLAGGGVGPAPGGALAGDRPA